MLVVDDGHVRLESAADLIGATCPVTESTLKARLGADFQVASIGPAGEHAVRYATISHDGRHAGRGGSGAVLGSKNVKAIAVRGTQRREWAHPRELTAYSKEPVEAVVRARDRQVPRARYRHESADLQSPRRLADPQLSERDLRGGRRHLARATAARPTPARARAASPAPSGASTSTPSAARAASAWSTRACSRSARSAASATPMPCSARPSCATSWASTRSARAARSRSPWSVSSADGSTSRGSVFGSGDALLRALSTDRPPRRSREPAG